MRVNYVSVVAFILVLLMFSTISLGQNKSSFWTKVTQDRSLTQSVDFSNKGTADASVYQLNIQGLKNALAQAPNIKNFPDSGVIIDFPMVGGALESFEVLESSVMEDGLQAKFPELRSYVGQSLRNPSVTIRFSVTPNGLHAMSMGTNQGMQLINPLNVENNEYSIFAKNGLKGPAESWACEFIDDTQHDLNVALDGASSRNADDGFVREYELALACTVEYAQFHGGTLASVTEAMMITMTRVNGLYERELSLRMIMIDNASIIFLGPGVNSDPYSNNNGSAMLGQNQTTITNNIGSANYDIGHVFSTGGGGIASLNSPCNPNTKARGVTGLPNPVGDAFDIDFVAHEMGHQFGAPHTFNGNTGNCAGGNRNATTAYEPGSGTTIMAYAGICAPQNVQGSSDAYFHQNSLALIWANISLGIGSNCPDLVNITNTAPVADAGPDYIIPISTPYRLTGSSTDTDGIDTHTYTWEQYDLGPSGLPTDFTTTGPMVRSYEGTSNPTRIIPRIEDILANGGVSTTWEKLPAVARSQTFRLTVRDNEIEGGQNSFDVMNTEVVGTAGPFVVTSQSTSQIVWTPGETETITWNVAGTTGNGINAANVNILLSTSDQPGSNFDTVLASNVPNNGSYTITVPNVTSPYCRIMVEAANNIFFNVNDNYFAIGNYTYVSGDICEDYFFNAGLLLAENSETFSGFTLSIDDSKTISDVNVSVDITTTNNAELSMALRAPFSAINDLTYLQAGANNGCPGLADAILTYDDDGIENPCTSTSTNLTIQALDPLSTYNGEDSLGDWTFFVGDVIVDGNRATWNSITLTICEAGGFIPVLDAPNFDFDSSFSVFPNPNNGEFTVKFKSNVNEDVALEVFDVQGRSILNQSFVNGNGDFNKNIDLGNVQSGLYLLNITIGTTKVTKKILVE